MSSTRDRLIETATIAFLNNGYGAVGTALLCQAANVNKGSFYHFFPSKAALLVACIALYGKKFGQEFTQLAASASSWETKISGVFEVPTAANRSWKAVHGHAQGCLVGNTALELGTSEAEVSNAVSSCFALWLACLSPIIGEALEASGTTPAQSLVDANTMRVIGMLQGGLLLAKVQNNPAAIADMAPAAIAILK
jgi:TetR/AcrR family transcriptional regulator, transcriptional repressor for nem operon